MAVRAKHFDYWISLDERGELTADGDPVTIEGDISAEHLLLTALARCSISSLEHFARQKDVEISRLGILVRDGDPPRRTRSATDSSASSASSTSGSAASLPTTSLRNLLESAEWGCFIGASLDPAPKYSWRVNGRDL